MLYSYEYSRPLSCPRFLLLPFEFSWLLRTALPAEKQSLWIISSVPQAFVWGLALAVSGCSSQSSDLLGCNWDFNFSGSSSPYPGSEWILINLPVGLLLVKETFLKHAAHVNIFCKFLQLTLAPESACPALLLLGPLFFFLLGIPTLSLPPIILKFCWGWLKLF